MTASAWTRAVGAITAEGSMGMHAVRDYAARSNKPAAPCPPPMHIVTTP
jgi:hypothetical protein